ncbi:MAG: ferrochelatase [candidate division Zixibacteria bacterium]
MIEKFKSLSNYLEYPADEFDFSAKKWGVLLLNMGGPNTLDDIQPYLFNLFCDKNIIKLPLSILLQKPLARFISNRRAQKVRARYEMIGGGSPQLKWTKLEAGGLEKLLSESFPEVKTYIGMRYTPPSIHDKLDRAVKDGCEHIIILPLYPHYTLATTGTSLADIIKWVRHSQSDISISLIPHWYDHRDFISLLRSRINDGISKMPDKNNIHILFTAHSLPVKLVESGDPYVTQVKETVRLAGKGHQYHLSYQSRSGPVKWLEPETKSLIKKLGNDGVKNLVVLPVSFVSDHIETLHEIDIELKEIALESGIVNFIRTESFNDDPKFIELLDSLVREKIEAKQSVEL